MLIDQNVARNWEPQLGAMTGPMRTHARAHAARLGLPKQHQKQWETNTKSNNKQEANTKEKQQKDKESPSSHSATIKHNKKQ